MSVITISRLLGSEGATIAERVAKELSYQLVTKETLERILERFGLLDLDGFYKAPPRLWSRYEYETRHLVSMVNKIMAGIANRGNAIILGRGGYAALQNFPGGVHIRLQAPFTVRVSRITSREGFGNRAHAEQLVKENDKARATFVNSYYNADFYATDQFHLVIDTHMVAIDTAVSWIVTAGKKAAGSKSVITPPTEEQDQSVSEAINAVLAGD